MKKHLRDTIKEWEKISGFEAFGKEDVIDVKTLADCLNENHKWLEQYFNDTIIRSLDFKLEVKREAYPDDI